MITSARPRLSLRVFAMGDAALARNKLGAMTCLLCITILVSCHSRKPEVDDKTSQLLNSMIRHVLLGIETQRARDFYGTKGDYTVFLADGEMNWPKGFKPTLPGFSFVFGGNIVQHDDLMHDRRLAIRLDRVTIHEDYKARAAKEGLVELGPIRISIQNGGGTKNGAVLGGCTTWYNIQEKDNRWLATYAGLLD